MEQSNLHLKMYLVNSRMLLLVSCLRFFMLLIPDPVRDYSKNIRVLWARALLDPLDMIEDDIVSTFLPPTTRDIVTSKQGASLFQPIIKFTEWIQARTKFIDNGLNHFLTSPLCLSKVDGSSLFCNTILIGAGYDTRVLRF